MRGYFVVCRAIGTPLALMATVGAITAMRSLAAEERVIQLTAKKFEYNLKEVRVKKGVPVVVELTSQDRLHGFSLPAFGVRADAIPGRVTRVRFVPDKAGRYEFFCDVFCGNGHEEMSAVIVVEE